MLLGGFAVWEQRQRDPLVPFSIFRLQTLTAANVAGFIMGTAMFSMFLMLTLYMQQVLGFSALKTGVGYLAVAGTAVIWANVAAAAVNRVGVKPALILGMALLTVGLLYFTQVSVDGSYWADLFPGFLVLGIAIPFAFVPITIAALAGTKPQEAGLASGLINTSQQIGGAVGIALLSTIAVTTTDDKVARGHGRPGRADGRVRQRLLGRAVIAFAGVLVSVFMVRGRDLRRRSSRRSSPRSRAPKQASRARRGRLRPAPTALRISRSSAGLPTVRSAASARPAGLRRDDADADRDLEAVERGEGVQVGRVVAGVERALQVRSRSSCRTAVPLSARSGGRSSSTLRPSAARDPRRGHGARRPRAGARRRPRRRCGGSGS